MSESNYFHLGKMYYTKQDYYQAEKYFWKCLPFSKNGFKAQKYLYLIFKQTNNYEKFSRLVRLMQEKNYDTYLGIANMEMREYNFQCAHKLIMQSMEEKVTDDAYFLLAKNYIQQKEYEASASILEDESKFSDKKKRIEKLILLYFLRGDYEKTLDLLNKYPCFLEENPTLYSRIDGLSKIYLHPRNSKLFTKSQRNDYLLKLESNDMKSDVYSISHIEKHKSSNYSYFFYNLDLESLYYELLQRINHMNPVTKCISLNFRFHCQKPIGICNSKMTCDIQVITTPQRKIITMFPILLSRTFNQEGYLESQELLRKKGN